MGWTIKDLFLSAKHFVPAFVHLQEISPGLALSSQLSPCIPCIAGECSRKDKKGKGSKCECSREISAIIRCALIKSASLLNDICNPCSIQAVTCVAGGLRRFKKEGKSDEGEGGGGKEGKSLSSPTPPPSPPLFFLPHSQISSAKMAAVHL